MSPRHKLWRYLIAASIVTALVLPLGFMRANSDVSMINNQALVMLRVDKPEDLPALFGLGLIVYCQLYKPEGSLNLFISADPSMQTRLIQMGYFIQILDADIQGAQFVLLYGLPESLRQAQSFIDILAIVGRQAVARLNPDQLAKAANLGIKPLPLIPQPLELLALPNQNEPALLPASITPNPGVESMMSQVTASTLETLVGNLSGEWSVTIDGSPYILQTRYTPSEIPIKKATKYAYEYFSALGLNAAYDYYLLGEAQKRSVIAEQSGITQPGKIVLLTAHIDDTSYINGNPLTNAPGADDNTSGAAAVLLIANILKQYSFDCTLRYALFSGEEQGLYGSRAYAQDVHNRNENVLGVLNLDMVGYNTPGSGKTIELHTRPGNNKDLQIANLFRDVIDVYNLNLTPQILQDGLSFRDHQAFWEKGYAAILAIEDWEDHTPYYHQTTDRLSTLQMSYYSDFVRAAIGTFAHMGCLAEGQLSGTVTDATTAAPIPDAYIEAETSNMPPQTTTTQPDGAFQLSLLPNAYTVTVSANNYLAGTSVNVPIQAHQTTVQNFSLCQPLLSSSFTFNPPYPKIDEAITFTATTQGGAPPYSYAWNFGDGASGNGLVVTHAYHTGGQFLVDLTAESACGSPFISDSSVYVDAELVYLPFVQAYTQP